MSKMQIICYVVPYFADLFILMRA